MKEQKTYVNPHLSETLLPSIEDIKAEIVLAEVTDPQRRDVRQLMSTLMQLETVDPRLNRHIMRRKTLIAAGHWDITASDKKDAEKANEARIRLAPVIGRLFDLFIESHMYGVAACELTWDRENPSKGAVPRISRIFKPVELEYNTAFAGDIAYLEMDEDGKYVRREFIDTPETTYITSTYAPNKRGGILRSILFHEYHLYLSNMEWSDLIVLLKGIIQGKVKPGALPEDKAAAMEALTQAVEHQAAVTGDAVDFEFHKITDSASGATIDAYQKALKDDIEIAITGTSALASDRKRNAPTVQERSEEDVAYWGRKALAEIINEKLLTKDYEANHKEGTPPWEFKWNVQRTYDPESMARTIETMLGFGAVIPKSEVQRAIGIRLAEKDEDSISSADLQAGTLPGLQSGNA